MIGPTLVIWTTEPNQPVIDSGGTAVINSPQRRLKPAKQACVLLAAGVSVLNQIDPRSALILAASPCCTSPSIAHWHFEQPYLQHSTTASLLVASLPSWSSSSSSNSNCWVCVAMASSDSIQKTLQAYHGTWVKVRPVCEAPGRHGVYVCKQAACVQGSAAEAQDKQHLSSAVQQMHTGW